MYIDTETIVKSYNELTKFTYSNESILHIFFILKGIDVNNYSYSNIEDIKNRALPYAQDLGSLFSDFEQQPEKNDFINPFLMKSWDKNPTEKLSKWISSRVKNNIIGGATTWRKVIEQDRNDVNKFKFVYNYVEEIKQLTIKGNIKVPIQALAIWTNRFTFFEEKQTVNSIVALFVKRFHITSIEKNALFTMNSCINQITYSSNLYETESLRKLIGNPKGTKDWIISVPAPKINIDNAVLRQTIKCQ